MTLTEGLLSGDGMTAHLVECTVLIIATQGFITIVQPHDCFGISQRCSSYSSLDDRYMMHRKGDVRVPV
ncbi:MAG: hypothetical protein D6823_03760 [Chloroflexi bacterium]|nr:MAG: hypothetical protein D6823_03760 [Chloroflexota bacterium]